MKVEGFIIHNSSFIIHNCQHITEDSMGNKNKTNQSEAAKLRSRAEEQISEESAAPPPL